MIYPDDVVLTSTRRCFDVMVDVDWTYGVQKKKLYYKLFRKKKRNQLDGPLVVLGICVVVVLHCPQVVLQLSITYLFELQRCVNVWQLGDLS